MKDYHDLLSMIRDGVVDMALVKEAVAETFSNRDTKLHLIQIEESMIETTQNYWNLHLRAMPEKIKRDLPGDFRKVIDEINQNSIQFGLVTTKFKS